MIGISELLTQYRGEKKLTQKELAKELEVSVSTINLWELGKSKPSRANEYLIRKICSLTQPNER